MRNLSVMLPDFVDLEAGELKLILAAQLYKAQRLSLGQAGELAGVSKRTFIELLGSHGVSLFNQDVDDLEHDVKNA